MVRPHCAPVVTDPDAYEKAACLYEAGRFAEAESIGRRILTDQPDHDRALHMLALIAYRFGRNDLAIQLAGRAIAIRPTASYYNTVGIALHGLHQYERAALAYRAALQFQPDHIDALNNLGSALMELKQVAEATAVFEASLRAAPDRSETHNNLGAALNQSGDGEGAEREYRAAIALKPDYADAHYNLGNLLAHRKLFDEATAAYRAAIQAAPDYGLAHNNLGVTLGDMGQAEAGAAALRKALSIMPDYAEAHNNLACALLTLGQVDEAVAEARIAVRLKPDFYQACNTLANALADSRQTEEAMAAARMAIQLKPDYAEAHTNLGTLFAELRQYEQAMTAYRTALIYNPSLAEAYYNLGNAMRDQGQLDASMVEYRAAIQCKPELADAHVNMGNAYKNQGRLDLALACYQTAMVLKPQDASFHSNLVYVLQFHTGYDPRAIREECIRWNQQHAIPLRPARRMHLNNTDPERRLRVGYVSADFCNHSVSFFIAPLLEAHNRAAVEIYCYSSVKNPDVTTGRLHGRADVWRDITRTSSDEAAELIRQDKIDILVDLSMHSAFNRMLMFARKPAPVQVSWLAYPGSTGLETMDYRLTDAYMEPLDKPQKAASEEQAIRLPDSWCCYEAMGGFPDVASLPALQAGYVTFGSLNNFCKVNEMVLQTWSHILHRVPRSRLLLLCPEGESRERIEKFFTDSGMGERVGFVAHLPWQDYLALYHRIDIGLDTFPCNGITITCHALWMGIPVVTLCGTTPVSRAGLGLLATIGLEPLAATTERQYVHLATELARDIPRLNALRSTLRERMRESPLMDAPRFATNVEHAYRKMWKAWCDRTVERR